MMFLRHGHAAQDKLGIDLIRTLSNKGIEEVRKVTLPQKPTIVFCSPAQRTIETMNVVYNEFDRKARMNALRITIITPLLYAPILLPEMDELYKTHGEQVRGYWNDAKITNTKYICKKAADFINHNIREKDEENTLIVAHGAILNFIAHILYEDELFPNGNIILDINLGTAKGFEIKNNGDNTYDVIKF